MPTYYNEIDPFAAAWIRELIAAGHIAPGDVDERSIAEVSPDDLQGYDQCHFFAGIGGWSLAVRLAGIPDDFPLWTGSCPCQPFSSAGKRRGTDDERHLWPEFYRLIAECCPSVVAGEQVASKAGRSWLAGVRADLEALDYGVGAADLCAAGVGAPHIRQRWWWVADAGSGRRDGRAPDARRKPERGVAVAGSGEGGERLGDASGARLSGHGQSGDQPDQEGRRGADGHGAAPRMGGWEGAIWVQCADGKARRIEPSIKPLVDGLPRGVVPSSRQGMAINANSTAEGRQGRLKAYGNAIVPQVAAEFLIAALEAIGGS